MAGLYDNIHAKRKRIAAGSKEKMRKPGAKGAPSAKAFKQAAKTTKGRKKVMAQGVPHYFRDGSKHTGGTHKMPNGEVHSGASHGATSKKLYHYDELSKTAKEKTTMYGSKPMKPKAKPKPKPKKKPMKKGY